ncbi:MAG: hypothetical protein HC792_00415 [Acaryochloridaceae cyanobacterium CSU_5_19]|nr:hypothetical protein [Acaryochloridaceae cyanobacterium CSU_5_19]
MLDLECWRWPFSLRGLFVASNVNISITPAVIVVTDLGNASLNTIIQGVLRATCSF